MSTVSKRTFSLPAEQAAYIDAKIESGAYASGSEVIRAGLRALQERDAAVERWLRDEVVPAYDAMEANPQRKISAKAILSEVRTRYSPKRKARRRADAKSLSHPRPETISSSWAIGSPNERVPR